MEQELTTKKYNIIIGLVLLWGVSMNAIVCQMFQKVFMEWDARTVFGVYSVLATVGVCMSIFIGNAIVSFIGFNLVVLPLGVTLSIALKMFGVSMIVHTFFLASMITIFLLVAAVLKPEIFESGNDLITVCLVAIVFLEVAINVSGGVPGNWWDGLVASLFSAYIGYSWTKAQEKERTLDNAIDSPVRMYLDFINMFIRAVAKRVR